jgi:hypothetical protein
MRERTRSRPALAMRWWPRKKNTAAPEAWRLAGAFGLVQRAGHGAPKGSSSPLTFKSSLKSGNCPSGVSAAEWSHSTCTQASNVSKATGPLGRHQCPAVGFGPLSDPLPPGEAQGSFVVTSLCKNFSN